MPELVDNAVHQFVVDAELLFVVRRDTFCAIVEAAGVLRLNQKVLHQPDQSVEVVEGGMAEKGDRLPTTRVLQLLALTEPLSSAHRHPLKLLLDELLIEETPVKPFPARRGSIK